MIDTDLPLVIAGKKAWLWEGELNGRNLKNVRFLDFVSMNDLHYLYAGAYCFIFPSLYEGFGLPPVEAMSAGCPVIVSHVSSLPEICGDGALYVDPYDVNDIREKIEDLLGNPQKRDMLSGRGKERAGQFSMQNYVVRLSEAYKNVI
jgi:glycosyltransferase involved in cell wall biosynthesis